MLPALNRLVSSYMIFKPDGVHFWPEEYPLEQTRINKIIWDSYYIRTRWEHYITIYIYIMNVVVLIFHFNYGFQFS